MKPLPVALAALSAFTFAFHTHAAPALGRLATTFQRQHLEKYYWSEGANFGDLNKDGKLDAVFGPYWWEGPAFTKRHELYPPATTFKVKQDDGTEKTLPGFEGVFGKKNAYSTDNFFAFIHDFNGDGWGDVLTYGLPNTPAYLYVNPQGKAQHWARHTVLDHVDNESPTFTDLTGDGKPEIVCNYEGNFGYASPDWANPTAKWAFTPITEKGNWQRFTHGLGVGDVNGDKRMDVMFKDGWFEQPASLAGNPAWKWHKTFFAPTSSQMFAYDVNGDGLNDVVTALASHGYGLAWYEQLKEKDAAGSPQFKAHIFMNKEPNENRYGVAFSQLHAVELVDMDGDGLKDIVTGKCFWAHGPTGDPDPNAPAVLYWFKLVRNADKSVDWVPHLIDNDSGVGRQIGIADVNGDKRPDIIIGNKKGAFAFINTPEIVSEADWQKRQPQVKFANAGEKTSASDVIIRTGPPREADKGKAPKAAPAKKAPESVAPNPPLSGNGKLPVGVDGKALNTDFETGDLRDWTATGKAFSSQPVLGDTVVARRAPMKSAHVGKHWIGTYENGLGDEATGTLTSKPFRITQRWAAFLVAAGPYESTRVEIVNAANGNVLFKTSGGDPAKFKETNNSTETLAPVVVDLEKHQNKEVFIRVVDEQAGGHWGHLNFDDFKVYAERPSFPNELKFAAQALPAPGGNAAAAAQKAKEEALPADDVKFSGLSPEDAAKEMTLPPGFKAHLFAGEPDVKQPIAFTIDDKGRLWVVENYTYPHRQPEGKGTDRILVFEDTNGDHKFDKRTVFYEGLNMATAIEYGFGGVYVGAAPWLMHIPVKEDNGVPKAAGEPKILLEGFAWHDTHETLNSFQWGPDGWLYGCHGVFTHSHVKRPDQPDSERQFINAGVWRYHPLKKNFEVFAEGTSNPWGIDFNEYGHCFIEACVIPHFFHIIQGARYQRQAGQHYAPTVAEALRVAPDYFKQNFAPQQGQPVDSYTFKDVKIQPINPFIYEDIKAHGDHVHYLGDRPHGGNNRSDAAGGGHAHAGLMVYLGGSWPQQYHGKVFMNNIHGQRINVDDPVRTGSGYVGKHTPDFVNFNDRWSQIINLRYDQDGSVYLIDWYDKQQCHNQRDAQVHDRSNGRIFKIVYAKNFRRYDADLQSVGSETLALMVRESANEWQARQGARILQERSRATNVQGPLLKQFEMAKAEYVTIRTSFDTPNVSKFPPTVRSNLVSSTLKPTEIRMLRLIWALHITGGLPNEVTQVSLQHSSEYLRSWIIQLLCEEKNPSEAVLKEFARMAKEDSSPMVRLYLASAMQRTPVEKRMPVLEALVAHAGDANDHNLPLMYWYAAEPVVGASTQNAVKLLGATKIPKVREFITRRMTAKPVAQAAP